jgi:PAS domain S-box-containing protein
MRCVTTIRPTFLRLKNEWGRSLHWRVLTWFLTTLLVFIGLQGYLSLRVGYTSIQDQAEQSNRQLADLATQMINAQYDTILQQVDLLRADLTNDSLDQQAISMLDFRRSAPLTYRALYLFDDDGRLLIHLADPLDRLMAIKTSAAILNRPPITPGADVWAAWRATGVNNGATYISPTHIVGADQIPVITLGLASPDQAASGAWRLVVEIDLRDLWRKVDKIYVGQTGRAFITSADGLIIAHPDRAYIGQRLPPALQPVLAGQGGQVAYLDLLSNHVMLAAFMPMSKQSGWGLVIEQQQSEAFLPATRILALSLAIALVASVMAIFIAVWLSRSITRPILHLAQVTQLIARTGDLHQDVAVDQRDEIGQLALAFNQMIASLRQTQTVLRESEERFQLSMEATHDGLWDWHIKTDEGYFSPGYYSMLGYEVGAFSEKGNAWQNLIHPDDHQHALRVNMDCIEGRCDLFEVEYRMKARNGEWRWILGRGKCIVRDEQGRALRLVGTHVDITERKRTEEEIRKLNAELEERVVQRTAQLEATNNELEAFSYSVSHDLRAPLRGIDGWSLALLEDYGAQLDEQAHTYINRVRSEAQRMSQLIDDMLELSRLARAEMRTEQVDLSAIAHTIAARLQESAPERQVEFTIQPGLSAHGGAHLLEIALSNLLGNAFKFTGKAPQARIEFGQIESQGQRVFFVRDNGVGFDMTFAKKLFGAFQRMHKTSEFPGTGIGLATVQRIVHRHGGLVWAEAHVNQGATFFFTLAEAH